MALNENANDPRTFSDQVNLAKRPQGAPIAERMKANVIAINAAAATAQKAATPSKKAA